MFRSAASLAFVLLAVTSCATSSPTGAVAPTSPVSSSLDPSSHTSGPAAGPTADQGSSPTSVASPVPAAPTPNPSRFQSAGPRSTAGPSNPILDAHQISADVGWVLTDKALVRTVDGGRTWLDAKPPGLAIGYDPQTVPLPTWNVRGVGALDDRLAFLATDVSTANTVTVSIWRTNDGGSTWAKSALAPIAHPALFPPCTDPEGPPCPYLGTKEVFDVVDAAHAFVTVSIAYGANLNLPRVFATGDGGATWRPVPLPPGAGGQRFLLVQFATASAGMIGMGYSVGGFVDKWWGTEDSGNHWAQMSFPPDITAWQPVTFWDSGTWVLPGAGFDGWSPSAPGPFLFNRTNDGGNTWMTTTVRMAPELIYGGTVRLIDPTNWIALADTAGGNDLDVWATTDAGSTWTPTGGQPASTWPATFVDRSHGWARRIGYDLLGVPDRALFATDDGGQSWRQLHP